MATTKTIQPTGETITIPAMTDRPDMSVVASDLSKITDAVNAENQDLANKASKSEVDLLANRFIPANLSSVQAIITNISATNNNTISIVGVNSSVSITLGGAQESGMMLCKYFRNDNIINYVIFGRQITIGKINTSTEEVTIVKTYA